MKQLPEEVRMAVYWLNASGRSMVADQLALWVDNLRKPIRLDFEQRQEAERLLAQAQDEGVLRDLLYELVARRHSPPTDIRRPIIQEKT